MIAYYIHWIYPPSADDDLYYAGRDSDKLFYHKENAEKYAKDYQKGLVNKRNRFDELNIKDDAFGLSPEEQKEWKELACYTYGDSPVTMLFVNVILNLKINYDTN